MKRLILLLWAALLASCTLHAQADSFREPLEIDVEEFIGVKSYTAKVKRITTYAVESITELEPLRYPEAKDEKTKEEEEPVIEDPDYGKSETDIIDEINGQMILF